MGTKGILVVSFGTRYEKTRKKTIGTIEERIRREWKDYQVYRAFTSVIIRKKLKEEGVYVCDVKEALEQIVADGCIEELIIQPTYMICGKEYSRMCEEVERYRGRIKRICLGQPLLSEREDYRELANIIGRTYEVEEDETLILMGHGSEHFANISYPAFAEELKELGYNHILVATVEGYPSLAEIKEELRQARKNAKENTENSAVSSTQKKKVCLVPMMIVAGKHANRDMLGGEDSWKAQLEREGFEVRYILKGLGELTEVQQMFVRHVGNAIQGNSTD